MTRSEAEAIYDQGKTAVVDCLLNVVERLQALEEQFAKNSSNSSKPPSSDGLSKESLKPVPQSLRKKTGKVRGGQKGHEGATLIQIGTPDAVLEYHPQTCKHCQTSLATSRPITYCRRQVFEMPIPTVIVTEHRAFTLGCPCCGKETTAVFPETITQPVQYGSRLLGLATYLHVGHLEPILK